MLGNLEMGSPNSVTRPTMTVMIEITMATIGRLMKKRLTWVNSEHFHPLRGGGLVKGCGFTTLPGPAFCRPSTIMVSPDSRPCSITHILLTCWPICTWRMETTLLPLALVTTSTWKLPCNSVTARCGTRATPWRIYALAGLGHASQPFADQAAHRGGFDLFFAVERGYQVRDAVEIEAAGDDEAALAVLGDVAFRLVLVADFADDDFQQVFHGGHAGSVAVLVHHDHHVAVFLLHLAHQVAHRLGLRNQPDGAHQFANGAVPALFFLQLEHRSEEHTSELQSL